MYVRMNECMYVRECVCMCECVTGGLCVRLCI